MDEHAPDPGILSMMMHTSRLVFIGFTAVLIASIACAYPAAGAQYMVSPSGGGFTSIQDAVTWASPLDTVTVGSGTYPETVKINKKITLVGVDTGGGAPVIDPGRRGNAVVISADGCTITGFTIQNSENGSGIQITSNGNTVDNNTLSGNAVGITLVSADSNTLSGNSIAGSTRAGIVIQAAGNNRIEGNSLTKNALGLSLDERSSANVITDNTFSNTENVMSRGTGTQWASISVLSYQYLGKTAAGRMGNYWSDYHGADQNADGIGDTPYTVRSGTNDSSGIAANQSESDPAPLMDPIEYYSQIRSVSPGVTAAQTLEYIPKTTPAVQGPGPVDTGSPSTEDFGVKPPLTYLLILVAAGIACAGGILIFRYYTKRPVRHLVDRMISEKTRPGPVLNTEELQESSFSPRASRHEEETEATMPVQETEVVPAVPETSPPPSPKVYFPQELESRYVDIRHIGRGGVAHVFAAHRKSDNRLVAVKIPISFDEVTGKCFLNEIAAWQTLRHPNIVEVLEVNILPLPYVEMEYVPGSLEAVSKPLPVWKAVHIVHGIADGLAYAHAHGIIHRDIKPHNILMTGDFVPKITDWGMSKVIATTMEKSSVAGFSLSYAAPEQVSPAEFGRTDVRTDIYQLGALFYELVTGSIPFGGESIVEVGNAIVRDDPIHPTEYNPDADAVEKIILKCLAKNPADRYQTADELLDALSRYLDEDD